jgi:hypothetical protein
MAAEGSEKRVDADKGAGDVDRSFGVAATRVRRSTSLVIIAGGMLTGIAGISGRPLALLAALVTWVVVIAGSLWLFHQRRVRADR